MGVEVFPDPVRKLWKEWEVRGLVLVSLALQVSLVLVGSRRKYITSRPIKIFTWSAYLMADSVATVALGVLTSSSKGGDELMAFWAAFLLLHLGGPDTITAFSFADNELWIRHMVGVSIQTSITIYIILMSWQRSSWLSFLTVPMLLPGVIKYGERSLALKSANRDEFHVSGVNTLKRYPLLLLAQTVACKFLNAVTDRMTLLNIDSDILPTYDDSYPLALSGSNTDEVIDSNVLPTYVQSYPSASSESDADTVIDILPECVADTMTNKFIDAYEFFEIFKVLFVDLILGLGHRFKSLEYMKTKDSKAVFEVIEIELGFAYDIFYTKAPINYTRWGLFSRFITFCSTFIVFVIFSIVISVTVHNYHTVDVVITFLLFGGAVILEIYSILVSLSSDWTNLWLIKHSDTCIFKVVSRLQFLKKDPRRWSGSMGQYNLLRFSLNPMRKPTGVLRLVHQSSNLSKNLQKWQMEKMENVRQLNIRARVSNHLQELIFDQLQTKSQNTTDFVALCTLKGDGVLEKYGLLEKLKWTTDVEFDHSILIWHIATDICYCSDAHINTDSIYREMSKRLADYLLYLLVKCPFMLPIGMGMLRFQDSCAEAINFFETDQLKLKDGEEDSLEFRSKLLSVPKGKSSDKSALMEACELAKILEDMKTSKDEKWKMVSNVWVEILGYAANQCRGIYHAEKLAEGGEFLTHVWFLMAHLGISQRYQN